MTTILHRLNKDVVTLIYRLLHLSNINSLNEEYYRLFHKHKDHTLITNKSMSNMPFTLNWRHLNDQSRPYTYVYSFKNHKNTYDVHISLPRR